MEFTSIHPHCILVSLATPIRSREREREMAGPKKNKKLRPMRMNNISIPEELLFSEVLARLPVKSLARFRCVCRSWRAGIADPAFVRRHRELSPPCLLDMQATSSKTSFQRFHPRTMETELIHDFEEEEEACVTTRRIRPTHCDGLVAIATRTEKVVVCNPATGEVIALPPGNHNAELDVFHRHVASVAIGYDQWRNSYVVARYFYRMYGVEFYDKVTGKSLQDYDDIGHEVFTLGQGRGWEATQDPPHAIGIQRPICTRRAFYWHSSRPKPVLMRFGLKDRSFDVVSHPPTGWTILDDMTELKGKLCYAHQLVGEMTSYQIWLADEDDELQWSLYCHIHLSIPPEIMAVDGDELLVVYNCNYLYRYDVRKQAMVSVVDLYKRLNGTQYDWNYRSNGPQYLNYLVPYVQTLVSPRACNY
jgi:F-box interacting protein